MANHAGPISCLALALTLSGCATPPKEALYPGTTSLLPGTEAAMNSAGYWIGRHGDPDRLVLDREGIVKLNAAIRDQALVRDLATFPTMSPDELKKELEDTIAWIGGLKVYQTNGRRVDAAFLEPIARLMNVGGAGKSAPAYGFLVRKSDLRVLPTVAPLLDGPGDLFIDNLQASSLEPGTALVILHRSLDGAWLYVASELVSGWLPEAEVAIADFQAFLRRYRDAPTVIITSARADLYEDEALLRFVAYGRMGTRLVLAERVNGAKVKVLLPGRDEAGRYRELDAWVDASQVSAGSLPYTARSIYRQAFALLNAPYGWGGLFGEQDCSQFLCQVFSTVGVVLPRNSSRQAKVGVPLGGFDLSASDDEKARIITEAGLGGATLLRFPGHIMLYLGSDGGKPYVIHSTWSYREKRGFREIVRLVNRVTVSDLELGRGGKKGSHLHRLTDATVVKLP